MSVRRHEVLIMDAMKVGAAIKVLRTKKGYTQHALVECLDVTDKAVSKWERGLGVPDVSILAKLAIVLNTDIDNLLAGNVCWIEHSWRGILVLDEGAGDIRPDTEICGNPAINIPLCCFLLAGIKDICIVASPDCLAAARGVVGDGSRLGVSVRYFEDVRDIPSDSPVFYIRNYTFIYGPNLTKCFQLAIARQNAGSVLVAESLNIREGTGTAFDETRVILPDAGSDSRFYKLPFVFIPDRFMSRFCAEHPEESCSGGDLVAEPLGRGMIACDMSAGPLRDLEQLVSFIQNSNGFLLYCPEEIAWRRGLINREQLTSLLADLEPGKRRYLESLL